MSGAQGDFERFRADAAEPLSFRERGATVPFTTPVLVNARIRDAEIGTAREMVLVNPSGARGALVVPWSAMPELCSPTLYDRHLWERLGGAEDISPIGVRREAQRLATQGLAGKHAATAAREAQERDRASHRLMRSILLDSLIAATETKEAKKPAESRDEATAQANRAEQAVLRAAVIAQVPAAEFAADLEALAVALSGVWQEPAAYEARLRGIFSALGRMAQDIAEWVRDNHDAGPHRMAALFVYENALQTMQCAEKALTVAQKLVRDLGRLVPRWKAERAKVLEYARTPDWVLDGWDVPLTLWQKSTEAERAATIWELAIIAPALPREAKAWLGKKSDWRDTTPRVTQTVQDKTEWRSGALLDMVTRDDNLISSGVSFGNQILPMRLTAQAKPPPLMPERPKAQRPGLVRRTPDDTINPEDVASIVGIAEQKNAPGVLEALGSIGQLLTTAPDSKLLKITALVDRLANAAIHERLVGPSLPRLRRLRPPRPASLKRLLFVPLAGALTHDTEWRRTGWQIPRVIIHPLTEAVLAALGREADSFRRQLRGRMFEDADAVGQVGAQLWRLAADAAPELRLGASLSHIGLTNKEFTAICGLARGLWHHAEALWEGLRQIGDPIPPEALRTAVIGMAEENRHVFSAALGTIVLRAGQPMVLFPLLKEKKLPNAGVVEDVLSRWITGALLELAATEFEASAEPAEQVRSVIEALEAVPRRQSSLPANDLVAHRRSLEQHCRQAYREITLVHLVQGIINIREHERHLLADLEAMARAARSLEITGQRMGTSSSYNVHKDDFRNRMDRLLRDKTPTGVTAMDVARITGILAGQNTADAQNTLN